MKKCAFCGSISCRAGVAGDRQYYACASCGGIFLDRSLLLNPEDERQRYLLHENTLENSSYREYLGHFIDAIMDFPDVSEITSKNWKIFDYGSGPEPSLVKLLREQGFDARGRDPYFLPDTEAFPEGADLVTCLEVVEHFANPLQDFVLAAECLRVGGFFAIGTHLLDDGIQTDVPESGPVLSDRFISWWYRQDPTHISFYSRKALCLVAKEAGLSWMGTAAPHVYLFRKEAGL